MRFISVDATATSTACPVGSKAEYHAATALEAVFGYLHLAGRDERAQELFDAVIAAGDET